MSASAIIAALIPTLPKLKQLITKPKTGLKESSAVVILGAAIAIINQYEATGSLLMVDEGSYITLVGGVIGLILRLAAKVKELEE